MTNIHRREFLGACAAATAGATLLPQMAKLPQMANAGQSSTDRPNVLFLMTDEQTYNSLSINGNRYVDTPNMDRIAREGVAFNNATCVTPYCSPSRASLITGQYPHRHEILKNVSPGRSTQAPLPQEALANTETMLHASGYQTAHRGKWHLGDKGDFNCYESFGYASKSARDYSAYLAEHVPASKFADHPSPGKYLHRPVEMLPEVERGYREFYARPGNRLAYIATIGRSLVPPEHLPETLITDQVLGKIDDYADGPFMITASWSPPHDLWVMPEPYYGMVDRADVEIPGSWDMPAWDANGPSAVLGRIMGETGVREYMAIYHSMVKYIDDQLGRILAKLDEKGLADNTLIVFTTDHGDMAGAHGCIGKSIFSFYDDLVHIPLMMRLPGKIKAGTAVDKPVSQIDVMPTIMDYLGMEIPDGIHGRSMRPLVEGKEVPWRDYAFCQRADQGRMLRTDEWKYTYHVAKKQATLYDLQNDPLENVDLAGDPGYRKAVDGMHARLVEVMGCDGDPLAGKMG